MRKAAIFFALLIFAATSVCAGDWRKRAEENPLDCAFYTLLKDDDRVGSDIERLAQAYFEVERYEDVVAAINLFEEADDKVIQFANFSTLFLTAGKKAEASRFLTEAVKNLSLKNPPPETFLVYITENLIELNRADEALKIAETFAGEFEDNDIALAIADKLLKRGQTEKARDFVARSFFRPQTESFEARAKAALIYAKLKQSDKARKISEELLRTAFSGANETETENNRRRALPPLIDVYLELGETDKAFELWNRHGDRESFYEFVRFADDLILYKQTKEVLPLLLEMRSNKEQMAREGSRIVKSYLKIGDVETAVAVAKSISADNDNFAQQDSFILLADRFIADGKTDAALDILDFAFQRARKIVFEHDARQSIGASSGTRKVIYLRDIFERLMKLKRFETAFVVLNSTGSDNWIARDFEMETLSEFVKAQIKILPRTKINLIAERIRSRFTAESDDDYYRINGELLAAELYALAGDGQKALPMIAKVLEDAHKSCCYQNDFLLAAGKVFARSKLQPDANIRNALLKFIKSAEN